MMQDKSTADRDAPAMPADPAASATEGAGGEQEDPMKGLLDSMKQIKKEVALGAVPRLLATANACRAT